LCPGFCLPSDYDVSPLQTDESKIAYDYSSIPDFNYDEALMLLRDHEKNSLSFWVAGEVLPDTPPLFQVFSLLIFLEYLPQECISCACLIALARARNEARIYSQKFQSYRRR
jgi:hypothetical protein